jgi:triacylglycerol lipase
MFATLAPARRRFYLGTGAIAVLALLAIVVAVVVERDPVVAPAAQDQIGPVLLVPGYGGNTSSLEVLARALQRAGRDAEIIRPPGDGTGDLLAQARRVGEAAQAAVDDGAPSVDVIGYSAGGVVVRLWVDQLGGGPLARRVMTLASPHHGSEVAGLATDLTGGSCPEACRQLAPDSDLLRTLNASDETPPGPLWIALWTTDDKTVVPPTSGSLEGAIDFSVQSVCPGEQVSHGDVPRTPSVIAMVLQDLGTATPRVPGPDVCS